MKASHESVEKFVLVILDGKKKPSKINAKRLKAKQNSVKEAKFQLHNKNESTNRNVLDQVSSLSIITANYASPRSQKQTTLPVASACWNTSAPSRLRT